MGFLRNVNVLNANREKSEGAEQIFSIVLWQNEGGQKFLVMCLVMRWGLGPLS